MKRSLMLCSVVVVGSCATNPVTGKTQLMLMSESEEVGLGRQMLAQTEVETGLYPDPALQAYVSELGLRLAHASERPNLPWEYHVIDDAVVNAFAAPGGYIFVTRGILAHLNSEAELAAVLGHETGHVTARHSAAMASQEMVAQAGLAIGAALRPKLASGVLGQVVGNAMSLYFLNFSRNDERQADALGHRYSLQAKYDPREMPKTFKTLQRVTVAAGARMPGFLSTHPDPGDRVQYTQAWADTVKSFAGLAVDRDRYLARIDGIVFGDDPEQGYFENGRFLHPGYRLQFAVPAGWQNVNQRSQVVSAEPNGNAEILLAAGKGNTPDAAAQAFVAQAGVQNLGAQRTTVNGVPGLMVQFGFATANNAPLRGEALFVQYGSAVFQFIGITYATGWYTLGGALDQSLRSFGATAPNQQFRRRRYIRVLTAITPVSMAALAQQSNGAITVQQLAIINGVEETATLPPGTKFKTVVYH